jgi:hypothetical protein
LSSRHFPPERWLMFNRLHGVISQKIEFCVTTAVRTSGPPEDQFEVYSLLITHISTVCVNVIPVAMGCLFVCDSQ